MSKPTSNSFRNLPAIALVGNPGSGKSTLLNGLAGSPQFRSGPSLCEGLTQVLQAYSVRNVTLYDTPGLFDVSRSKQSGEELDKLLSQNIALKIAFVVTLDEGRVRRSDILTIKLVLDAISVDTSDRFGVIVNKMGESVEALMRDDPEKECRMRKCLTGNRNTSYWCYVRKEIFLEGEDDKCHATPALQRLLHGLPVTKPLYTTVSRVETQNLDTLLEAVEVRAREVENSKGEEFRGMMEAYELQKLAAEERIRKLEQELHEPRSKSAHGSRKTIEDGRQAEDVRVEVVADSVRAVEIYNRAIEEGGDVNAMILLARLLGRGADGVPADTVRAVRLYERAIEEGGSLRAMYNLAVLLRRGVDGVPKDPVRAAQLYNRLIEEDGHVKSMYSLALLLRRGANGVPADTIRAARLYNRAIEEGGDVKSMYNLAVLLEDGADDVPADAVRAVHLYRRAIEEGGDVRAMFNLAELLRRGANGVPADIVRAVHLYNQAIEEGGHVKSMYNLAVLLRRGVDGVPKDPVRAAHLRNRLIAEGIDVKKLR